MWYNLSMNVLIVGNVLKDVYLRLDERHNDFEYDESDKPWLDLCFDGSTHPFFRRNSVYGGAAVTLEVVKKFGLTGQISGSKLGMEDANEVGKSDNYRYILCYDDHISYFTSSQRTPTVFTTPDDTIDWIMIDRSANISDQFVKDVSTLMSVSNQTKLAVYVKDQPEMLYNQLIELADVVFTEGELKPLHSQQQVCTIHDEAISLDDEKQEWHLPHKDLLTHLTAHSIIAASLLSALILEKSTHEALKLAKLNVENATLDRTMSLEKLEELI